MTSPIDHPLAAVSRDRPKAPPPADDQTPTAFPVGFLPTAKQRLKNRIGLHAYPLMNAIARNRIETALREAGVDLTAYPRADAISLGHKGFGFEVFLRTFARFVPPGGTVVAFGCGLGYEAELLARFLRPARVIGYDFFNYRRAWDFVAARVRPLGVEATFIQADLREPFTPAHPPADALVSFCVLEHLRDMDRSFGIIRPLLRQDGWFGSLWGPMWASYSGDHISHELGEEYGFEHLRLSPADYLTYYKQHPRNRADVAAGVPTWLELGLHNFARYAEYEAAIDRHFGRGRYRQWQLSQESLRYRQRHSDRWAEVLTAHPALTPLDLILQGAAVVARPD